MFDVARIDAAVRAAGPGALASHRSAAWLWNVAEADDGTDVVDVIIPRERRFRSRPGITVHRPRATDDLAPSHRAGVPCTNPLRTLVDLGAVVPAAVEPALETFAVGGLVTVGAARAVLERHGSRGRHGVVALRRAIAGWPLPDTAVPDSRFEVHVARWLQLHGLTGFEFHPLIEGFEVDFAHHPHRLVLECDGYEYHSSREAFERDRHRDAVLTGAGWRVLRITWRMLFEAPDATLERLRAALASGPQKARIGARRPRSGGMA